MTSSPSMQYTSHIYSESPASPSYITSSLPSTSPHSRNNNTHEEDGDSQCSLDSLADATEAELQQRVDDFMADSPEPHAEESFAQDGNQQFDPFTSMNGGGRRRDHSVIDPLVDLPRSIIEGGGGAGTDAIIRQSEGAMQFLRAQVAELDKTDWMYSTPEGFGSGPSSAIGSRENQIGREDPHGWTDQAFNIASYPVLDDDSSHAEYTDENLAADEDEGEDEDEGTRTEMVFNDSLEDEELESLGNRFSDGMGQATNQARNELTRGVEGLVMTS